MSSHAYELLPVPWWHGKDIWLYLFPCFRKVTLYMWSMVVPSPEIGEADIIKKASASLCDSLLKKFWGVLSIVDLAYVCIVCSHEGRSWYSAHRGILWIASTAKPPQPSEIAAVEDFYRKYYSGVFAENCLCFVDWCRFIWQVHLSVTA